MPQIERRFIRGGQLRAKSGDKPGIEGYAAVYNQKFDNGWFFESIKPGAFSRALKEKQDVRCLFNHNPDNLLGRTKSNTLRMTEDDTGLHYECDTDPEIRIAADVQGMVERGDIDGCSFAFVATKQTWHEETDADGHIIQHREIEDVDLYDVGPVTYPAYEGTSVNARALWPQGIPAEVRSHVPSLRTEDKKTKRVDGEDLTADCFLIVGNPDDTSTWKLPWKFSTDEKTKGHLRNALARFDQLKGVSEEEKKKAWKKLLRLCEEYGIDVSEEDKQKFSRRDVEDGDGDCTCPCGSCQSGECKNCDCDGCGSETCGNSNCNCGEERMRLKKRAHLVQMN